LIQHPVNRKTGTSTSVPHVTLNYPRTKDPDSESPSTDNGGAPGTEDPVTISKDEVNRLPLVRYNGEIRLVRTPTELSGALRNLRKETLLGFDTETRPSFRKGQSHLPSLVQLAGEDTVYLFQLNQLNGSKALNRIYSNSRIIKAGIAIRDDIRKLHEMSPFKPLGFHEISDISQSLGIINTGLRSLAAMFLRCRISKGAQITNWSRRDLTPAQIRYAATDAWISRRLYAHFAERVAAGEVPAIMPLQDPLAASAAKPSRTARKRRRKRRAEERSVEQDGRAEGG
jgi:hypothetical protein